MTAAFTISDGTYTVNLNDATTGGCGGLTLNHRFSNPETTLSTPIDISQILGDNVIAINLGMVDNSFDMTFKLFDGYGTFNFQTPTTNYEKLVYLANYNKNVKILTLGSSTFNCQIESINIPFVAGQKDLVINGTMTVRLAANVAMQ
jgi:hypothetical protein